MMTRVELGLLWGLGGRRGRKEGSVEELGYDQGWTRFTMGVGRKGRKGKRNSVMRVELGLFGVVV